MRRANAPERLLLVPLVVVRSAVLIVIVVVHRRILTERGGVHPHTAGLERPASPDRVIAQCGRALPSFHDPCHPGPSDGSVPSHRAMRRQSFVLPPPDENRAAHPRDAAPDRVVDPRRPRHKNVVDARPV
jgi:hypothetical protein